MGSSRKIGGKNLLDGVRRHQRDVFLVKAFFVFSIAAFIALLNILLLLSGSSLPAILTVVLLDVTQVVFFLLALRSIPRYVRKVLLATDSFPGTPDLLRGIEEVVEEVSLAAGIVPLKLLFIKYEWEGAPIAFCFKEKRKQQSLLTDQCGRTFPLES